MRQEVKRALLSLSIVVSGGICYQCSPTAALINTVTGINPCGTILNCDPRLYQFATSGIEGPGYYEEDPFCTFPPFCGDEDPIFGGLAAAP